MEKFLLKWKADHLCASRNLSSQLKQASGYAVCPDSHLCGTSSKSINGHGKADRALGSHFTQDFHSGISNQGGSKGSVLDSADRFPQAISGLYHLTSQVKQGQCELGSEQDLSMGANPAFASSLGPGSQGQDGETVALLTRISPVFPWV